MQWEYKTVKVSAKGWFVGGQLDADELERHLNDLGDDRWELVSILSTTMTYGATREIAAVFKRPRQT